LPAALCHNPAQNRVYVANFRSSSISVLRDSAGGVEESPEPQAVSRKPEASVVRGVLHLLPSPYPLPAGEGQGVREWSWLLDATGRKVMELRPGANDVRHLVPGVYFIRKHGSANERLAPAAVHKVVVQR